MRVYWISLLFLLPWGAALTSAAVEDPKRDFLKEFLSDRKENVIETEADLNGDGVLDYLYSLTNSMRDGRQGNIWVYYQSLPGGGYQRFDELTGGGVIAFHQKAASIQKGSGKFSSIYRYSPAGAGRGAITSYEFGPAGVGEKVIHADIAPLGAEAETYTRWFENPKSQLVYRFENAGALRDRYFPLQRWLEQMTFLRWCLLAVGVLAAVFVLAGAGRVVGGIFRALRGR